MHSTEAILEATLLIRPRLEHLLDSETAQQINTQILQLLTQVQTEQPVENSLLALLAQHEPTRLEMKALLDYYADDRSPSAETTPIPDLEITRGISYTPLPGQGTPQSKPQFQCPICSYTWSRLKVGKPTPLCPDHQIPLNPIPQ
jgi:hypothetical protein